MKIQPSVPARLLQNFIREKLEEHGFYRQADWTYCSSYQYFLDDSVFHEIETCGFVLSLSEEDLSVRIYWAERLLQTFHLADPDSLQQIWDYIHAHRPSFKVR